jgi:hypothetical protein
VKVWKEMGKRIPSLFSSVDHFKPSFQLSAWTGKSVCPQNIYFLVFQEWRDNKNTIIKM